MWKKHENGYETGCKIKLANCEKFHKTKVFRNTLDELKKIKKLIRNNEDKAKVIGVLANSGRQLECCF